MANGVKEYKIVINGIEKSIEAVASLNEQLNTLEKRIEALEQKNINVNASSKGGGKRSEGLEAEDKLQRQIINQEDKIIAARTDEYQILLQQKAEFKEINELQKSNVAQVRLEENAYAETMQGMKQKLADIKSVMQTMDLGDDKFAQLAKQANELNTKLKDIEESYGQYGRNVGNYAGGIVDGLGRVHIKVGDVEREFKSASAATRTLKNELNSLSVEGKRGTKEWEDLKGALTETRTAIQGTSVGMKRLMDTMESFVALSSVSNGLSALFGMDDSEIQESIQRLVALQNVMQGLQTLNKQITNQEGIGFWLAKSNKMVDGFAARLLKVDKSAVAASKGVKILSTSLKLLGGVGIAAAIIAITVAFDKMKKSVENMRDTINKNLDGFEAGAQAYAKAKFELEGYIKKIDQFNGTTKEENKLLDEINKKYNTHYKSLKDAKDAKTGLVAIAPAYLESVRAEAEMMAYAAAQANLYAKNLVLLEKQKRLEDFLDRNGGFFGGPAVAQASEDWRKNNDEIEANIKAIEELGKKTEEASKKAAEARKNLKGLGVDDSTSKEIKSNGNKLEETIKSVEEKLARARINEMKRGFVKTMAELELERNKRIQEAKQTGYKIAEQIDAINREINERQRQARIDYYTDRINEEKKLQEDILAIQKDTYQREMELSNMRNENKLNSGKKDLGNDFGTNYYDLLTYNYDKNFDKKIIGRWKELQEQVMQAKIAIADFNNSSVEFINNMTKDEWVEQLQKANAELEKMKLKYPALEAEAEEIIDSRMTGAMHKRLNTRRWYYGEMLDMTREYYDKQEKLEKEAINVETQELLDAEQQRHDALAKMFDTPDTVPHNQLYDFINKQGSEELLGMTENEVGKYFEKYREQMNKWIDDLEKKLDEGKISVKEYAEITGSTLLQSYIKTKNEYDNYVKLYSAMPEGQKEKNKADMEKWTDEMNVAYFKYMRQVEQELETHKNREKVITDQGNEKIKAAEQKSLEERKRNLAEFYSNMTSEYERALSAIRNKASKQYDTNSLGIFNYKVERRNLKDMQEANAEAMSRIASDKKQLVDDLKNDKISFEDFDTAMDRLNVLGEQAQDTAAQLGDNLKKLPGEWWGTIDAYLQLVGQAMSQVLGSLDQIGQAAYEKQMEALEEQTDALEKQLDKQKELTQKYADDVNSIEDELSSARGDRRQHLIDQLNAEIAAQRESWAEEKRIEKEKEKKDREKKDLEDKEAKRKKRMAIWQAVINAALAISSAAVNSWPIPAVPMIAAATAVGSAQLAAVMSAKYAKGGVIQGKSHEQGGVKVLGGRAEVEGGEFITNKNTTAKNAELLYYINSKKKKVSLDDMIEFYSTKPRKTLGNMAMRYAAGGQLPTLTGDIGMNDRLLDAFEDYASKPTVVQVVDIIDRTEKINNVKVLAGAEV